MSDPLREAVEALAEKWDGYGHGRFNIHHEHNLPCAACDLLADLRALLAEHPEPDAATEPAPELEVRPDTPTPVGPTTLAELFRGREYTAMRMGVTLLAYDYARIAEAHYAPLIEQAIEQGRGDMEALERKARSEALREAADWWTQGGWARVLPGRAPLTRAQVVGDWLRERADRIAGGS